MSRVRPAVLTQDDLPDTMTAKELADYERVDVRTLRLALDAGEIAGAYRRGSSWRINKAAYFAGLGCRPMRQTTDEARERIQANRTSPGDVALLAAERIQRIEAKGTRSPRWSELIGIEPGGSPADGCGRRASDNR